MRLIRLRAAAIVVAVALPGGAAAPPAEEIAVFAGGCFWGIEAVFEHVKGVRDAESGYAGGALRNPSHDDVSAGRTGHAEAVRVRFDPAEVSYEQLLRIFFFVAHDPTQLNRQGPDVGTQYRSAVFFSGGAQQRSAATIIAELGASKAFRRPIVTQVVPLDVFWPAERYHQDYVAQHPNEMYIVLYDAPKVVDLKRQFPEWYRAR